MAPGSIFHHISFRSTILISYLLSFAIFYFPFHKQKIPKILLYHLSSSIRSHFANNREGIDNPFVALVASWCLFVQGIRWLVVLSPTGLIPWFSKLREILTLLCCITLSSSREKPMQAQEVARRISGAVAGEAYAKSSQDLISHQLPISGAVAGEIYVK